MGAHEWSWICLLQKCTYVSLLFPLLYRTTDGKSLVDGQALALTQKHIFMKNFTKSCNNSHIHY